MQFDKKHWNPANIPGTPRNSKMTGATLVLELEPLPPLNRPESETLWKTVNTPLVKINLTWILFREKITVLSSQPEADIGTQNRFNSSL